METCKYTKLKWSSTFIKLCRIVIFMLEVSWEYIYDTDSLQLFVIIITSKGRP